MKEDKKILINADELEKISYRIRKMQESATLMMTQMSRKMEENGEQVIKLSIGEPDFDTPEFAKQGGINAILANETHYPPVAGYNSLKDAIIKKLKIENNLEYNRGNIVVSTGAKHSLMNVIISIINPGDEVIIPAPYWVSYRDMVEFCDGVAVEIECKIENNFKVKVEEIKEKITKNTRAIMLNSPSNPTGSIYSQSELKAIAELLEDYPQITIISDEIYEHINFIGKHESIAQFDSVRDRVVIINGVSKGYAMTGWRIGYIAAPIYIAKAVEKLQGQFTSGACSIAQKAAEAALNGDKTIVKEMTAVFKSRRDLVKTLLNDIPNLKTNTPDGAFYFFCDVSYFIGKKYKGEIIKNSDDLAMKLLYNEKVSTVGGLSFGSPSCLRISYATKDSLLKEALKRMKQFFSEVE